MDTFVAVAFGLAVLAWLANYAAVLATIFGVVDYWPPGERGLRYYLHWSLAHLFSLALLSVASLDWGSLGLPRVPSLAAGVALLVPGFAVALAAGRDLGTEETKGLTGELRTGGWYRYSRNPQYVGYLTATAGFALLANSTLVAVLCVAYCCWWLTLPFAEEPWLREQYGAAYERYAERVPRFVGIRTVHAVVGDGSASPE